MLVWGDDEIGALFFGRQFQVDLIFVYNLLDVLVPEQIQPGEQAEVDVRANLVSGFQKYVEGAGRRIHRFFPVELSELLVHLIHIILKQELVCPGKGQRGRLFLPGIELVEHNCLEQPSLTLVPEIVFGMTGCCSSGILDNDMSHLIHNLNFFSSFTVSQSIHHEVPTTGFFQ